MNILDIPVEDPLTTLNNSINDIEHERVINENEHPRCFEDYHKKVRNAAEQIYESGNAPDYLLHYLKTNHIGDEEELEILLIDIFTPFISNSQINHLDIVGTAESGKSKLANTVSKIIPVRYVEKIKTNSPKYVYYKKDWNLDYNYIIFQDAVDSDNVNLLKTITDPENDGDITHKTVIDKKSVELKIPGKVMAMITHAKDFVDIELNTRLRRVNPDESGKHNNEVKNELKNGFGQYEEDPFYKDVARALFELLSKTPLKVFNPHMGLLNVENMGKRDVKMFRNSCHAVTFLNQKQRHKTESGVLLGTYDDYLKVKELWGKYQYHQQYKLTTKQLELLSLLNTIPEGESVVEMSMDDGFSYQELASFLKRSPATIKVWINGRSVEDSQSEKLGLKTLELVDVRYSGDEGNGRALIYRTVKGKEVAESLGVTPLQGDVKLNVTAKTAPFPKITNIINIIYSFIISVTGKRCEKKFIKNILNMHDINSIELLNDDDIFSFFKMLGKKGIITELTNYDNHISIEKFFHKQKSCNAPKNQYITKDNENDLSKIKESKPLPKNTQRHVTPCSSVTVEDETPEYEIIDMTGKSN
ncbi:hypothetical protein [Methanobacterium sp. MBAC-LM]|uniref:hypothetical protein n=1 Tax=Methanobacterium sp. MBAC-LM TaxID=3412034 RepID=UPI003C746BD2